MKRNSAGIIAVLTILFLVGIVANAEQSCYTIVVGKDASVDGWVIMAHNEDDWPPQVVNHHKVLQKTHQPGTEIEFGNGPKEHQWDVTWGYVWAEIPEFNFSDSFLNQWGVCITSDSCPSKEDDPETVNGGITKMLRRLVAQRAKTAREGVQIASTYVERYGYGASGRTYIISDPNEGWLFEVVNGKHWIAARVPDDEVAIIANTYSIHAIELSDSLNFLASEDIIDYAIGKGWYDPDVRSEFDFARAYANRNVATSPGNLRRQWAGLNHISAKPVPYSVYLPFSVKPKEKVSVADVMAILRDHYEGTELDQTDQGLAGSHRNPVIPICRLSTMTSFIAELRGDVPADVGLVYWVTLGMPCGSVYIPFHYGISDFPAGYRDDEYCPSEAFFKKKVKAPFNAELSEAFWTFSNFTWNVEMLPDEKLSQTREAIRAFEERTMARQDSIQKVALETYETDKENTIETLTVFSNDVYQEALRVMEKTLKP
jgi:dipeptidase